MKENQAPPPCSHVFLNKPERGSPKKHLCQIICKSGQYFWTRRFLNFHSVNTLKETSCSSGQTIFKDFPFGCHGYQSSAWNSILWTTLLRDQQRNITLKFYQNWPSGLGGDVFWNKMLMDNVQRQVTKPHSEPLVQLS